MKNLNEALSIYIMESQVLHDKRNMLFTYGKGNCLFYRDTAGQWANPSASKTFAGDVIKTCSPKTTCNKSARIIGCTG